MPRLSPRVRDALVTTNLTLLLMVNLFFITTLILAAATVFVLFGADNGFFLHGTVSVSIGGALVVLYSACMLMAICLVVMMRRVFIQPVRRMTEAMNRLAEGDFTTRMTTPPQTFTPQEIRRFVTAFNKTAQELGSVELLRKDFVNNFSHEFKTPIVSMNGFAELLLEEELPEEERREYLAIIRDESKRLSRLADDILTLNRIETQGLLTEREALRLDEQLRRSILAAEQRWRGRGIRFVAELAPCTVCGSASMLKEIWLNLLDNAAKFSDPGGAVAVSLREEDGAALVGIADSGCGMDEETSRHIFEQFYQGDTSRKTQGNGLGLAMAQKIAALHGGVITVESSVGVGSRFTVRIPTQGKAG